MAKSAKEVRALEKMRMRSGVRAVRVHKVANDIKLKCADALRVVSNLVADGLPFDKEFGCPLSFLPFSSELLMHFARNGLVHQKVMEIKDPQTVMVLMQSLQLVDGQKSTRLLKALGLLSYSSAEIRRGKETPEQVVPEISQEWLDGGFLTYLKEHPMDRSANSSSWLPQSNSRQFQPSA